MRDLYIVGYGLSGGFGGIQNYTVIEAVDTEDAENQARQLSVDDYEMYVGSHGLRDFEEIMEEDEVDEDDEDEAWEIYEEEMDGWLDYKVEPFTKERYNELNDDGYGVHNRYTEITDKL